MKMTSYNLKMTSINIKLDYLWMPLENDWKTYTSFILYLCQILYAYMEDMSTVSFTSPTNIGLSPKKVGVEGHIALYNNRAYFQSMIPTLEVVYR